MCDAPERDDSHEWMQAELIQLIYQRVRDMPHPTVPVVREMGPTGDVCVFCGREVLWSDQGHDVDCLWAEAKAADDPPTVNDTVNALPLVDRN